MFLDTVLRQKMHNRWAAARQKHQNDLCAKRRLRYAWASAQSDHSLRCSHGETSDPLSAQRTSWSDWVDAQADLSLCKAQMSFCWFCRAPALDALQLLLLLLLQINTSIIAIATAAERKCRCVGFVVRRLRMHYNKQQQQQLLLLLLLLLILLQSNASIIAISTCQEITSGLILQQRCYLHISLPWQPYAV